MGSVLTDTEFLRHTFIVIDFETVTPKGRPAEPIEVAAVAVSFRDGKPVQTDRYEALIRPQDDVPVTPFDTAQTGITTGALRGARSAADVMAALDSRLAAPPYRLVAHNAAYEAGIIAHQRAHCPTLAATSLLDTVRLARAVYPELPAHRLDDLLRFLRIPRPADRHRAMPDVHVTIAVFERILTDGAAAGLWANLHQLDANGGIPPKTAAPAATDDAAQQSLF